MERLVVISPLPVRGTIEEVVSVLAGDFRLPYELEWGDAFPQSSEAVLDVLHATLPSREEGSLLLVLTQRTIRVNGLIAPVVVRRNVTVVSLSGQTTDSLRWVCYWALGLQKDEL